jgi:hypothetical protein
MHNIPDLIEELEEKGIDELRSIVDGEERAAYRATRNYLQHLKDLPDEHAQLVARAVVAKLRISDFVNVRYLHKSHILAQQIMAGNATPKTEVITNGSGGQQETCALAA